jgi:hypothetical protein
VARYLVRKAIELGVPHFLGQSVIELAGHSRAEAIELAGKWRHGYIPLDTTALSSKMKGRTGGKQWWVHGESGSEGGGRNIGKKLRAVPKSGSPDRIPGVAPGHEFRKQGDGKYASYQGGRKPRNKLDQGLDVNGVQQVRRGRASAGKPYKVPHHTQTRRSEEYSFKPRVEQEAPKRKPGGSGGTRGQFHSGIGVPKKAPDERNRRTKLSVRYDTMLKNRNPSDADQTERDRVYKAMTGNTRRPGVSKGVDNKDTGGKYAAKSRVSEAAPKRKPGVSGKKGSLTKSIEAGKQARASKDRTSVVKSSPKPERGSKMDVANLTPRQKADNYLEMHGTDKVRARIKTLEAKENAGTLAPRFRTELDSLRQALGADSERKFQAQKSRSRLTPEQLAKRRFAGNGSSGKA